MSERGMARADLATGIVLLALSVAVIAGSWSMDRLETRRIHPLSAPGFTPGLLGIALAVVSVLLVLQAIRSGGGRGWRHMMAAGARPSAALLRLLAAAGLSLLYALVLIGSMPYWLATALYVASFILVFEWTGDGPRWQRTAWAVGIGLAGGIAVSYLFSELFLVRLP